MMDVYAEATMRNAAFQVLRRRREAAHAKELADAAEQRFLERAAETGVSRVELPEATVQVIEAERRTVSVEKLTGKVPEETLKLVTKTSVDTKLLDQAVSMGLILDSIARAATKVTSYKNVRVDVH